MADIVELMREQPDFYALNGASDEEITLAEKALELQFAKDYRKYIAAFGVASLAGHELTGISSSKRLDVISVTRKERLTNSTAPSDWYVIEQANIDSISIWQNAYGAIFLLQPGQPPRQIASSLIDYLNL